MRYAEAAARSFAALRDRGVAEASLSQLVLARALDLWEPGKLDIDANGYIRFGGARIGPPHATLRDRVGVAGVAWALPVETAGYPLNVRTDRGAPTDPHKLLGPVNAAFLASLRSLLVNRVKPLGVVDVDRLVPFIDAGVIVAPASPARLRVIAPLTPAEWLVPKGAEPIWPGIVDEFRAAWDAYLARQVEAGRRALADSEAAIARWEALKSVLEAVRDLPTTIATTAAGAAADIAGGVIAGLGWRQLLLYGGVGAVALAFVFRGQLLRAVLRARG